MPRFRDSDEAFLARRRRGLPPELVAKAARLGWERVALVADDNRAEWTDRRGRFQAWQDGPNAWRARHPAGPRPEVGLKGERNFTNERDALAYALNGPETP